ncbi:MAG TPA: fatty acid desaturase [Verrucomicrobiales bacterium]|nr:fatty acid desaturase [Verrucomicrobiales bacterium]
MTAPFGFSPPPPLSSKPGADAAPASRFPTVREWKAIVTEYQQPSVWRAIWQLVNTLVPYAVLWVLMYHFLSVSWWIVVPLAVLAGALMVRVFIIFHDCGHGSFFSSRRANDITGFITGILTFTPYYQWRWEHSLHHATTGDLDRRGIGDVWTMTVQEYLESSRWKRFAYKLARNPVVLFLIAPFVLFVLLQRIPNSRADTRERRSVWHMNLALLGMIIALSSVFGLGAYLILQTIITSVAGVFGVWLFYIQHQFEDAYWERHEDWDYTAAALQGSSFYKLPRILQWFSGNIGYHHIHHLSSRIPNYNLERCHHSHPVFQQVKPITIRTSLKSLAFRLWDEKLNKLVGYRRMREVRREQAAAKTAPDKNLAVQTFENEGGHVPPPDTAKLRDDKAP